MDLSAILNPQDEQHSSCVKNDVTSVINEVPGRSRLLDLPMEIKTMVLSYLRNLPLKELRLTCRELKELAEPRLYYRFTIGLSVRSLNAIFGIIKSPLLLLVHEIVWNNRMLPPEDTSLVELCEIYGPLFEHLTTTDERSFKKIWDMLRIDETVLNDGWCLEQPIGFLIAKATNAEKWIIDSSSPFSDFDEYPVQYLHRSGTLSCHSTWGVETRSSVAYQATATFLQRIAVKATTMVEIDVKNRLDEWIRTARTPDFWPKELDPLDSDDDNVARPHELIEGVHLDLEHTALSSDYTESHTAGIPLPDLCPFDYVRFLSINIIDHHDGKAMYPGRKSPSRHIWIDLSFPKITGLSFSRIVSLSLHGCTFTEVAMQKCLQLRYLQTLLISDSALKDGRWTSVILFLNEIIPGRTQYIKQQCYYRPEIGEVQVYRKGNYIADFRLGNVSDICSKNVWVWYFHDTDHIKPMIGTAIEYKTFLKDHGLQRKKRKWERSWYYTDYSSEGYEEYDSMEDDNGDSSENYEDWESVLDELDNDRQAHGDETNDETTEH